MSEFTMLSDEFAATGEDIGRALRDGCKRVEKYASGQCGNISPVAIEAHASDDNAGGRVVTFSETCELRRV